MTTELVQETCTPCRGGIPPLTAAEAARYHVEAPDWALLNDSRQIERTFWFANFREALTFVQRVGDLAESEHHHPDIAFGWGRATVSLQTKKIKGLHKNDFIMAAKMTSLPCNPAHKHVNSEPTTSSVEVHNTLSEQLSFDQVTRLSECCRRYAYPKLPHLSSRRC
jgi:4a-hydroxytetrahydrobiopterin dehydratase